MLLKNLHHKIGNTSAAVVTFASGVDPVCY